MRRCLFLCLFLCSCFFSSCSTQHSEREASRIKTFDLGKATVQLPATWRLLDTAQAQVLPHRGRDYILQNPLSRHAEYREMLAVDFIDQQGEYSLSKMGSAYADYLEETFDDVQISSIEDTTVNGQLIQVMQCAFTLRKPKTKLISTVAFTQSYKQLIAMAGTAVRGSKQENLTNHFIFRRAIFSFTWK